MLSRHEKVIGWSSSFQVAASKTPDCCICSTQSFLQPPGPGPPGRTDEGSLTWQIHLPQQHHCTCKMGFVRCQCFSEAMSACKCTVRSLSLWLALGSLFSKKHLLVMRGSILLETSRGIGRAAWHEVQICLTAGATTPGLADKPLDKKIFAYTTYSQLGSKTTRKQQHPSQGFAGT